MSAELLSAQEVIPRARIMAHALSQALPGASVNVYVAGLHNADNVWLPRAWSGEQSVRATRLAMNEGTLGQVAEVRDFAVFDCEHRAHHLLGDLVISDDTALGAVLRAEEARDQLRLKLISA